MNTDIVYILPATGPGKSNIKVVYDCLLCPIAHNHGMNIHCENAESEITGLNYSIYCKKPEDEDCAIKKYRFMKQGGSEMSTKTFEERIRKFNEMIAESNNIVFFGGAGVSTESGIPDFRSKDGLYNNRGIEFEKYDAEYLLSKSCLLDKPEVFYEFYRQKLDCREIEPNITHKVLAKLEKSGKLSAVITQNIDGLHQKAGSKNVLEIHGTTMRNYCNRCNKEYDTEYIFVNEDKVPRCECDGMIRPDVTLYEEFLPQKASDKAYVAIKNADMLIIGGTSLLVYPAANMINWFSGDNLVIINRDITSRDEWADLVFHEKLGEVFSNITF